LSIKSILPLKSFDSSFQGVMEIPFGNCFCLSETYDVTEDDISSAFCLPTLKTVIRRAFSLLNFCSKSISEKPSTTSAISPSNKIVPSGLARIGIFSKSNLEKI